MYSECKKDPAAFQNQRISKCQQCATRMQIFVDYRSPGVGTLDKVRHVGKRQDHAAVGLLHLGWKFDMFVLCRD